MLTERFGHLVHQQKVLAVKLKPIFFLFDVSSEQESWGVEPHTSTMNAHKMMKVTTFLYFYFILFLF